MKRCEQPADLVAVLGAVPNSGEMVQKIADLSWKLLQADANIGQQQNRTVQTVHEQQIGLGRTSVNTLSTS